MLKFPKDGLENSRVSSINCPSSRAPTFLRALPSEINVPVRLCLGNWAALRRTRLSRRGEGKMRRKCIAHGRRGPDVRGRGV
ncbi:hypothetical protein EVAR_90244_1 [Eumeta japonica]|uniref:Uncharacterized protein n=1 Tax=Eumeta variegata TaxID=151549 RepID=A0A4C1YN86_EUMVA|nr:hypothetical protein EVAR_90244_1 [Eumeta japonica]